jgi:hypothetical protein
MSSANVRFEEVPVEVNRNCEVFIPPEPPPSRFKLNHLSNDPSQDYFADGMTDELITGPGADQRVTGDLLHLDNAVQRRLQVSAADCSGVER